jgi:hypothetical protein
MIQMTNISISTVSQLADARAFLGSLIAFEGGSGPLPDSATILGEGENEQPAQVIFVAPGVVLDTTVGFPVPTAVVNITTSRDLDELNPMAQRMEASDASTAMHVGDVVVAVKPGTFEGEAS